MRLRHGLVAGLVTAVAAAAVLVAQPAAAADTQQCSDNGAECPVITHVAVSRSSVTVSGAALVPVTYTIGLTSRWSYGIATGPIQDSAYSVPLLQFNWSGRSLPTAPLLVGLHRISGTAMQGDWRATIYLPSTVAGTIVPSAVNFIVNDDPSRSGDISIVPDSMRVPTTVDGSHQPKLTIGFHDGPAGSKTVIVTGQVLDRATGTPMPNVSVRVAVGQPSCLVPLPKLRAVSNANGVYALSVPKSLDFNCVGIAGPPNSDGLNSVVVEQLVPRFIRPVVNFGPATSAVTLGHSVTLSGSAALDGKALSGMTGIRGHVVLQRWFDHAWQTVGQTYTRSSGRFDLVATPSGAGNWSYRAVLPGSVNAGYWTGVSRVVTIAVR